MATSDLERLAAQVKQRRAQLQLAIEPAVASVGMGRDTWIKVEEKAQPVRATSYAKIESVLQWAPGSVDRILDGKQPITIRKPRGEEPASDARIATVPKSELERSVGDAVQSAAMATKSTLTAAEILELNERVLQELRDRGIL